MKIETQYNIGDRVWFMSDNRIENALISWIQTTTSGSWTKDGNSIECDRTGILYRLEHRNCHGQEFLGEHALYPTKEALLASL